MTVRIDSSPNFFRGVQNLQADYMPLIIEIYSDAFTGDVPSVHGRGIVLEPDLECVSFIVIFYPHIRLQSCTSVLTYAYSAVRPPSMTTSLPVTKEDSSEAR